MDDKIRVIVADDDRELCDLVKTALERKGYEVKVVNDGFELIAELRENQDIDAIVLDLVMPEKGGISVFETIRSVSPASKLIIYTGHTDYRNTVYGREADAFVEKTEGVAKIIEILEEIL